MRKPDLQHKNNMYKLRIHVTKFMKTKPVVLEILINGCLQVVKQKVSIEL